MKLYSRREERDLTHVAQSDLQGGKIFGFPLRGFGLFTSVLLSLASAFFVFFASTCIAIFSLLAWNLGGRHSVNYADSYLYVGFPAGVIVLAIALPFFLVLWVRAKFLK
jgi:hypothetical protein